MRSGVLTIVCAVVVALSACAADSGSAPTEPVTASPTSSSIVAPTSAPPTSTTSSDASSVTSTTATTTTITTTTLPTTTSPATTLPPVAAIGPTPGSAWSVVGVDHDDVLNIRAAPDPTAPIVGRLGPTDAEVEASGAAYLSRSMIWWEVRVGGLEGYVASRYLAALGSTDDATASVIAANGGERPSASSMDDLVAVVLSNHPLDRVVIVRAPTVEGAIGECTADVFVDGDDSVRGERLVVFGQRDGSTGPFSLYAVETTTVCWRGVDDDGRCV